MSGKFINFYLPYVKNGVSVSPQQQALQIINETQTLLKNGAPGVAITYSANYGQTLMIESVYAKGGWNTFTGGANQAMVMYEMETLDKFKYCCNTYV